LGDADRINYENQIKTLERQLMKAQEGKIENTDSILEISAENKKLTNENREL